jgi:hypothetical protein
LVVPRARVPREDKMTEEKKVSTDQDGRRVEGVIVSEKLSNTGLLKVRLDDGPTIVRHKNRVSALNDAACSFLGVS